VLSIEIDTASAKIRTGPPSDDAPDYDLPIWAGLVPLLQGYAEPIADPGMKTKQPMAQSAAEKVKKSH
jgi:hypothetical protein